MKYVTCVTCGSPALKFALSPDGQCWYCAAVITPPSPQEHPLKEKYVPAYSTAAQYHESVSVFPWPFW